MGEVIRKVKRERFVGWYLRYVDADGQRKQRASQQPSYAAARRMLVEIEARIARGRVGLEERALTPALTVAELFARYAAKYCNPKCKDLLAYRQRVKIQLERVSRQAPRVARLDCSLLSGAQLAKVREALLGRYPQGTVRTTLAAVSAALNWAVREGLLEKNPAVGVARPAAPAPQIEFLSTEEVRQLLVEAERRSRVARGKLALVWGSRWVALAIAIHTGARKGEIFGLRWQDVDLSEQRLTIARSYATTPKSGKARHLRLPAALAPLLREWRELCPDASLVCPVAHQQQQWGMSRNTSAEHGLLELLEAAGCRVLRRPWHLLRHTFASHFMQNGGSLLALSQILGHSDVKVTMIYAHLGREFLDGEMERVKY